MLSLLDKAYRRLRREELKKAKVMLKKIKIDVVFDVLTNNCWKYGIHYEVIMKNSEVLEIKMKGRREQILLKFHKTDMVFIEDYERFVLQLEDLGIKKGIYITTGVFEVKIIKNQKKLFPLSSQHVKAENNFQFIKGQLGCSGKAVETFKYKKLKLFKYLPD